jgi:hypothetical protein
MWCSLPPVASCRRKIEEISLVVTVCHGGWQRMGSRAYLCKKKGIMGGVGLTLEAFWE